MGKRGYAVLLSGLLLLAVWLVIGLGWLDPAPRYPSLAEEPDPAIAGTIAYTTSSPGQETCLYTVAASGGEPTEQLCPESLIGSPVWTPRGRVLLENWTPGGDDSDAGTTYLLVGDRDLLLGAGNSGAVDGDPAAADDAAGGPGVTEIDPKELSKDARKALRRALRERAPEVRSDGARVVTRNNFEDSARVVVKHPDGKKRTILRSTGTGPRYAFVDAQWSPDGKWVLVSDSVGRLLIIGADGEPGPRVVVDERVGNLGADWYLKGERTYTVRAPRPGS